MAEDMINDIDTVEYMLFEFCLIPAKFNRIKVINGI